jgi:hypothetical protein
VIWHGLEQGRVCLAMGILGGHDPGASLTTPALAVRPAASCPQGKTCGNNLEGGVDAAGTYTYRALHIETLCCVNHSSYTQLGVSSGRRHPEVGQRSTLQLNGAEAGGERTHTGSRNSRKMPGVGEWRPGPKWVLTGAGTASMSFSSEAAFRNSLSLASTDKLSSPSKTPKSPGAALGMVVDNPAKSTQQALHAIQQNGSAMDNLGEHFTTVPKQKVSSMGYKLVPNQSQVRLLPSQGLPGRQQWSASIIHRCTRSAASPSVEDLRVTVGRRQGLRRS